MNDDTFIEASFRFLLKNWFDVMLVFAFLLLLLTMVYINKARAAHGDPSLFENKVKDQLYHRTIIIKSKPMFKDIPDSLKQGASLVDRSKIETSELKDLIEKEEEENDALREQSEALNELADLRIEREERAAALANSKREREKELVQIRNERESFSNLDGIHLSKPRERSASNISSPNKQLVNRDLFYYKN